MRWFVWQILCYKPIWVVNLEKHCIYFVCCNSFQSSPSLTSLFLLKYKLKYYSIASVFLYYFSHIIYQLKWIIILILVLIQRTYISNIFVFWRLLNYSRNVISWYKAILWHPLVHTKDLNRWENLPCFYEYNWFYVSFLKFWNFWFYVQEWRPFLALSLPISY